MSKDKMQAACEEAANNIEAMMLALLNKGFTRDESVTFITGMLASTQVYAPFAGVVESPTSQIH